MAYQSWSVTFGEQPSAAKWNILGTNDASFNDGTGIANAAIKPTHLDASGAATWVWTAHTPTYTGFTATVPSGGRVSYVRIGKMIFYDVDPVTPGTSNASTMTISLPVAARTISGGQWTGLARVMNNGTYGSGGGYAGLWQIASGGTTAAIYPDVTGSSFTASGNKNFQGQIIYEAA